MQQDITITLWAHISGTPAPDTAQSDEVGQQVQPSGTPKTDKTSPKTPQSDDADTGGCGCGS